MSNVWSGSKPGQDASVELRQLAGGTGARLPMDRERRASEEFVAMVVHELRTPLSAISNWAQVLKRAPGDADVVLRAAAAIERSARLQAQLVDDLLDVSRGALGKMELIKCDVELDEVIQASLAMVRHSADAKRIALRYRAGDSLRIRADARRLQQILVNLLTNAIRFTPDEGSVSVDLGREPGQVVICVADTGCGISAELLPRIFERFRQEGNTGTSSGGLGLGLNIVKNLIELHGGSAEVASAGRGQGAKFTVRLPCVTNRQPAVPEEQDDDVH